MKPKPPLRNAALSLATFTLALTSVPAASLYWDIDDATAGAGGGASPNGTWSTGGTTWSTSPNGTVATPAVTTALTDDLFFSAGSTATGAFTITLNDSQDAQSLTFQRGTVTIDGAGGIINLGGTGIINVPNNATGSGPLTATIGNNTNTIIAGTASLTKTGVSTLILNGSAVNTFTGGLNVNGGTLDLRFANLATPTDLVNSGNALALGGGNVLITGNAAGSTIQTLGNVTVNSGGGSLLANPNGGTDTSIALGSLTSTASGGSFVVGRTTGSGAGTLATTTTTDIDATGIYGGRVVFADGTASTGYDWAANTGGAGPNYTLSAYAGYAALDTTTAGDVTDSANSRLTAGATLPALSNRSTNSLKFENPASAQTLDLVAGNTLTLSNGGLLFTGAGVAQGPRIANGSITAGNGSGSYDLVVHQFNGSSTINIGTIGSGINNNTAINSNIVNNGGNAVTLVKNGPGGLVVGGTNSFTGGIVINQGNVAFNSATAINNNPITFNANSTIHTFGGSSTSGDITLNNGSQVTILNNNSSFTVTGNVTGSGGISAANGGQGAITLNLNGTANNFAGPIRFTSNNGTQPGTINVASLPDTDALRSGNIIFGAGSSTPTANTFGLSSNAVAVSLTNRHFDMAGDLVLHTITNAGANAFTINSDLIVTGTRAKHLQIGGAGAGISTFAGVIANNASPTAPGTVPIAIRNTGTGLTTLTLASVEGIVPGATISGTGIAGGTTITAVNYATRVITLSAATTAATPITTIFTIPDVVNSVSVTKAGAGTWALSGTGNSYTGSTFISAGVLEVTKLADAGSDSSIGRGGVNTSNVFFGSGTTLRYAGSTASITNRELTYTPNANNTGFVLDASGTGAGTVEFSSTAAIVNTVNNQGRYFTLTGNNAGSNILSAQINNNGTSTDNTNIIKNGTGKWVLTNANSAFTGAVFINDGTVSTNSIKDSGTASPIGAGLRFTLGNTNNNGTLEYTGGGDTSNRETRVGTPSTLPGTGGGSILNNGGGALVFNATTFNISQTGIVDTRTLTLGGTYTGAANEVQGIIQDNTAITGLVNLQKTGVGTWALSGTNTYTGTTTVNAGTLLINGINTGAGLVTVTAGTLGGTGTTTSAVTIGDGSVTPDAVLAPGTSIESIDTGNLTFDSDGSYAVELNGTLVTTDVTNVTGSVTINAATTLAVSVAGTLSAAQQFVIISNDGMDGFGGAGAFAGLAQDAVVGNYGAFDLKISYTGGDGNDIVLYTSAAGGNPYDTWATGNEDFNDDANLDGVDDGLAWFLTAATPSANAADKVPVPANDGAFLTLDFDRVNPYAPAKLYVQFGNDLIGWTEVEIPAASGTINLPGDDVEVVVTGAGAPNPDSVTIKIPTSYESAPGTLFARLRATEN